MAIPTGFKLVSEEGQAIPSGFKLVEESTAQAPPETGFADIFTGSERIAATPELGTLPEFGGTPEGDTFKIALGMLSTFKPEAQLEIIKEQLPEAEFRQTDDGSTIIKVPTDDGFRESVLNRPGFSPQDVTTSIAQMAAFVPSAKLANVGRSLVQKFSLGALGAGATEQALQEGGLQLGRKERDLGETALAAGLGGAAELVKPAFQGTKEFLRARRANVERGAIDAIQTPIQEARGAVEGLQRATGQEVGLFQAQQTLTPSDLVKQRILPQLESSSLTASKALEAQNKEVFEATNRLIATIAPDQVVETGAGRFRDAAARAVDSARIRRSEIASPIYKQSFRRQRKSQSPLLNTEALENKISGIIRGSDDTGQIAKNLKQINKKIVAADGNLQKMHSVKVEIDNLIEGRGDNSIGRITKRFLTQIKNDLVDTMVAQSPSYRAARDEFIRLTPAVNELDNSLVGRIANIPDDQLKSVAGKIFDPKEINPTVLKKSKKVINDVDPGAWNDLVRVETERRLGGLRNFLSETGEESVSNIPGQIRTALFGNPKNRQVFLSALDKEQRQNFRYLEDVLGRSMKGRAAGSPTTPFKEALDKMRGVSGVLRDTIFRPVSTVQGVGEQSLFDSRTKAIAELMFNPQWKPQMNKLRKLDPNSSEAARVLTQFFRSFDEEE